MALVFRRFVIALVLLVGFAAPSMAQDEASTLVVNLTTDDVWTAQMALGFAQRIQEDGGKVVVFLNVRAVALAITDVPQHTAALSGMTPPESLAAIMAAGGRVFICPTCTRQAGYDIEHRIEGVEPGGPEFRAIVMAPGTRVMSF